MHTKRLFKAIFMFWLALMHIGKTEAAPDSLKVKNFVVKCYIVLVNSKPTREEIPGICEKYNLYNNFNNGAAQLIDTLLSGKEFCAGLVDRYRNEYFQGALMEHVYDELEGFKLLLTNEAFKPRWKEFREVVEQLEKVTTAAHDLETGVITISELQKRFFNCNTYKGLNMGPDNFVISTFNYVLFRNPTAAELKEAKKMLNGEHCSFFFRTSKGGRVNDYLDVLFDTPAYNEGQIRYWYNTLLNREPDTADMITTCGQKQDIRALIKIILLKKEFTGI